MQTDDGRRDQPLGFRCDRRHVIRLGIAVPALGTPWLIQLARAQESTPTTVSGTRAGTPAACTSPAAASPPVAAASPVASPTAAVTVRMTQQLRFEPAEVTIRIGEAITWLNDGPIPHTSTDDPAQNPVAASHPEYAQLPAGSGPWDSGLLQPGQTFSHTFDVPGEYHYYCIPHVLSGMRGIITVSC